MVYPAILPLMRTPRLPVVDCTDAPRRFKWTGPFSRKTKSGFCLCAITFQTRSNHRHISSTGHSCGPNMSVITMLWNYVHKSKCIFFGFFNKFYSQNIFISLHNKLCDDSLWKRRLPYRNIECYSGQLKCDGASAETIFRLSTKRASPFKPAGVSSVDYWQPRCAHQR